MAIGRKIEIVGMDETDEVIRLQKLHVDTVKKEMFFQIVLRVQHTVTICKVDFMCPFEPEIKIGTKQIVREAINRGNSEYLGEQAQFDFPTEL